MLPLLLCLAFLLSPRTEAGEIIGGHESRPHSRPYMAYLQIKAAKNKICGGFLVREDVVLTAAHCKGGPMTVTLGAHDIKQKEKTQQVIRVKNAIYHPGYNGTTHLNDIMLLQLEKKAKLTNTVKIIRLPTKRNKVKPGMVCTVAGWGRLGLNIRGNGKLHEVDLKIQKKKECTSRYPYYNNNIQMCVGDPKTIQTSFKGDSGGPFICNKIAQGIVSYGNRSAQPPRVYVRISAFLPWIKSTMKHFNLLRQE